MTNIEALELSIEQWKLMAEGLSKYEAYANVCENHKLCPTCCNTCFLCRYSLVGSEEDETLDCDKCPAKESFLNCNTDNYAEIWDYFCEVPGTPYARWSDGQVTTTVEEKKQLAQEMVDLLKTELIGW